MLSNYMFSSFHFGVMMFATISAYKNNAENSSRLPFVLQGVHVLILLFVFIYVFWCATRFPYQMMFMSLNSNTTGVTCGARTANPSGAHEFTPGIKWGSCCSIFSFLCNVLQILFSNSLVVLHVFLAVREKFVPSHVIFLFSVSDWIFERLFKDSSAFQILSSIVICY